MVRALSFWLEKIQVSCGCCFESGRGQSNSINSERGGEKTCGSCFVSFCGFDRQGPDVGGRLASVKKEQKEEEDHLKTCGSCFVRFCGFDRQGPDEN